MALGKTILALANASTIRDRSTPPLRGFSGHGANAMDGDKNRACHIHTLNVSHPEVNP